MPLPDPPRKTAPNHLKRLAWLSACVFTGLLLAVIGNALLASSIWYLAIPAAVAIGWLFLADPSECAAPPRERARETADHASAD